MFKIAGQRGVSQSSLITVNYVVASVLALLLSEEGTARDVLSQPLALTVTAATGAVFVIGFHAMSLATVKAGIAMMLGVARISVVIPFLASWFFWHEEPGVAQLLGLVLAVAAFILISRPRLHKPEDRSVFFLLALVFLLGGIADTMMKTINELLGDTVGIMTSTFLLFTSAALFSVLISFVTRGGGQKPKGYGALVAGVVLGLFNLGTVTFILNALSELPGTVVFPANNVSIVVGGTLLGALVWKEVTDVWTWSGIAIAVVALVLLGS